WIARSRAAFSTASARLALRTHSRATSMSSTVMRPPQPSTCALNRAATSSAVRAARFWRWGDTSMAGAPRLGRLPAYCTWTEVGDVGRYAPAPTAPTVTERREPEPAQAEGGQDAQGGDGAAGSDRPPHSRDTVVSIGGWLGVWAAHAGRSAGPPRRP